ncbi:MAG: hypothetical protein IIB40_11450 [Candidatus Marinimicrobia bacterium]|nr:hypothetical protein [Candidatus Neomarinimicrobiota bacterium]
MNRIPCLSGRQALLNPIATAIFPCAIANRGNTMGSENTYPAKNLVRRVAL